MLLLIGETSYQIGNRLSCIELNIILWIRLNWKQIILDWTEHYILEWSV